MASAADSSQLVRARAVQEASLLSGGSLVDHGCSFSTDNKYLLCCSGIVVKVFSCATGAQVRMLVENLDGVEPLNPKP